MASNTQLVFLIEMPQVQRNSQIQSGKFEANRILSISELQSSGGGVS